MTCLSSLYLWLHPFPSACSLDGFFLLMIVRQHLNARRAYRGFAGGSDSKKPTCSVGDLSFIPGWGRSPGGGNGYPLQYSCLEMPTERGAWWATVHGVGHYEGCNTLPGVCCAELLTVTTERHSTVPGRVSHFSLFSCT